MANLGPEVHQQLLEAYANVQGYLESERDSILDAKVRRDELSDDRNEALDSLSQHYLPELTENAIAQTWSEMRDEIRQVLHRKQEHLERVESDLSELNRRRESLDEELIQISDLLDRARREQDRITTVVEQQLREDQAFVELSNRAALAEAALERAEANLHEIDQESSRKLPAYDESSLFRYLYDRGYGTQQYQSRGFTRRMDRWLAGYIGFLKARQSYEFLLKTPDQMRHIIAEDRQALDTVMADLEQRRDRVAENNGLPGAMEHTAEIKQKRQKQLQVLDVILEQLNEKNSERTDITDVRGSYYQRAIELFRKVLDGREVSELRQRAEKTEEITDDKIVARLIGVDVEIEELDQVARRQRERLDEIQAFLEGLGRVIQRFRAAQFDSTRSSFLNTLNIDQEVARAHEEGDVDGLWKRIRRAQRWGAIESEDDNAASSNPMQRILVNAMSSAAGDERSESARRAGNRRARQQSLPPR